MWLVGGLALGLAAPVAAEPNAAFEDLVTDTMDGLEWGMSYKAVFAMIEERIRAEYKEKMLEAANDVLVQDRVVNDMNNAIAKVKRDFVVFDARVSGWDVSVVGPEFRRGSGEAMLVYDDEQSRNYYFFMRGKLWKWYREFKPGAFGGNKFDVLSEALQHRFGSAKEHTGTRLPDGPLERWMDWDGPRSRLTAIDKGNRIVLLLADQAVTGKLAIYRRNAIPRGRSKNATIDAIFMTEDEREDWRDHQQARR